MRLADLSPLEIADLLQAAYRQDQGEGPFGPDFLTRMKLADYLGCHEEARAEVLEVWWQRLAWNPRGDPEHAEYWLDAEFVEPCQ